MLAAGRKFEIEIRFLAFFEAKMTKNDIPNPKLIDLNDNQPFYIRILRFFLSFSDFDLKILVFQLQKERSQKSSFLGPNPHYLVKKVFKLVYLWLF